MGTERAKLYLSLLTRLRDEVFFEVNNGRTFYKENWKLFAEVEDAAYYLADSMADKGEVQKRVLDPFSELLDSTLKFLQDDTILKQLNAGEAVKSIDVQLRREYDENSDLVYYVTTIYDDLKIKDNEYVTFLYVWYIVKNHTTPPEPNNQNRVYVKAKGDGYFVKA